METTLHVGDADEPPNKLLGNCIDALDRLHGFVGCLRDTIEVISENRGTDYGSRLYVADYISLQLERIANDLGRLRERLL